LYNVFCSGGGHLFIVSPNPANNTVTVSLDPSILSSQETNSVIDKLSVYDLRGNLKMFKTYPKAKQANLDIASLPNGNYFIEILSGIKKEQQPLIIQK
jgi:hypothetical protein